MDALFHDRVQLGAADDAQLHVITGVPDQDAEATPVTRTPWSAGQATHHD